ncbi:MAG: shikimate dehydrogenase [Longimicrobiales bacterium]
MTVTAATRTFAILGDPVSHSLSPVMQNAAFRAAGVDGIYVALRCADPEAGGLLAGIARAGGGGNVTVPHKTLVRAYIEKPTELVLRTGACNTFWLENGRICGDNTDVIGFAASAADLLGSCAGIRALLIGAGGGARAAAIALMDARASDVAVLNRSPAQAQALVEGLAGSSCPLRLVQETQLADLEFDLVVNATPLGLELRDPLPADLTRLRRVGAALDLVYRPGGTPWTRHAAALGVPAADGIGMLVAQGAAAFERWWRRPAPVEAMRAAVDAAAVGAPAHGGAPA